MAQEQENPIYWDQNATRWNLTLIFSLAVAVLGIIMTEPLLIILGLGMSGYSWLTTPRRFLLYRDSVVVVYGMPRTRVVSFAEVANVELLALPLGERLRIRMLSGRPLMLMMRDPGAFRGHLDDALARYHGQQTGAAFIEGTVLERVEDPNFYESVELEPEAEADLVIESEDTAATPDNLPESSGSYSEFEEDPEPAATETYSGQVQEAARSSGSYTERSAPDFSGEGEATLGAEVELEITSGDDDPPERPRSPY